MENCPECGNGYKSLGAHWRYNPSHRPNLTQEQREIVTGLMLGDGSLNRSHKNPRVRVNMVSNNYLKHIDETFGILGLGVRLKETAAESASVSRRDSFHPDADKSNYQDIYSWYTRNLPELKDWNWYDSGEKCWPDEIILTPTVLKHWYCGDGTYVDHGSQDYIGISMSNEVNHTDKVDKYFERVGLPTPSNYNIHDQGDRISCNAQFTVEDSRELFDYMGDPLPDFEYKWP